MKFRQLIEAAPLGKLAKDFEKRIKSAKKGECSELMKEIQSAFKEKKLNASEFDEVSASCGRKMDMLGEALNEDHFEVGDEVKCIASGMTGKVVKLDKEAGDAYYVVKREDGSEKNYKPEELEILTEGLATILTGRNYKHKNGEIVNLIDIVKKAGEKDKVELEDKKGKKFKIDSGVFKSQYTLLEGMEDVVCEAKHKGNVVRVHFHEGEYVLKVNEEVK
jgi:hypothetical protein